MRPRSTLTLLFLLGGGLGLGAARAQPTINGPDSRAIRVDGERQVARFPLQLDGQLVGAKLLRVSVGEPPIDTTLAGFAVGVATEGPVRALDVTVDPGPITPAEYALEVLVSWSADEPDATPQHAALTVRVTVPAPQVAGPARLVMHRQISIFGQVMAEEATPLVLREVSGRAPLRELTVTQVGSLKQKDGGDVPGVVTAKAPTGLGMNGHAEVPWTVHGELGPGETEGKLSVAGLGLAEPLEIEVEVHTRISAWWILPITLFGVGLGFWVREILSGYKARRAALDLARRVVGRIDRELATTVDVDHRSGLTEVRATLIEALRGGRPEQIEEAANTAEAARVEARVAFVDARRAQAERLAELQNALVGRPVPDRVAEPLEGRLREIAAALDAARVVDARRALDALNGPALPVIRQAWEAWRLDAVHALAGVERLGDLADGADVGPAREALTQFQTGSGDWAALFEQGGEAAGALHSAVTSLLLAVDREAMTLVDRLAATGGARALAEPVERALREARTALADYADGPLLALDRLCLRVPEHVEALLLGSRPAAEVREMVKQRKFMQAAPTDFEPESSVEGELPVDYSVPEAAPAASAAPRTTAPAPPVPTGWRRWISVDRDPEAEVEALLRAPSQTVTWIVKLALASANAVVISLLAYVLYADEFTGTGKQIATLLLWAFGLDLGASSVTERVAETVKIGPEG